MTVASGEDPTVPDEPLVAARPDQRFLTLPQVADELSISMSQTYAIVKSGELKALKLGGRGVWRVERSQLEEYIQACYAMTSKALRSGGPAGDGADPTGEPIADG